MQKSELAFAMCKSSAEIPEIRFILKLHLHCLSQGEAEFCHEALFSCTEITGYNDFKIRNIKKTHRNWLILACS